MYSTYSLLSNVIVMLFSLSSLSGIQIPLLYFIGTLLPFNTLSVSVNIKSFKYSWFPELVSICALNNRLSVFLYQYT